MVYSEAILKVMSMPYIFEHCKKGSSIDKVWVFSQMEEMSYLSPTIRRKLAEISVNCQPSRIEPEVDEKGNPTGRYRMKTPNQIESEHRRILEEKLPTCYKHLAPCLVV